MDSSRKRYRTLLVLVVVAVIIGLLAAFAYDYVQAPTNGFSAVHLA
ncbi:MAG: hypothetical protein WDZ79_01030 [Candidatus Paceibacterota bacterium]